MRALAVLLGGGSALLLATVIILRWNAPSTPSLTAKALSEAAQRWHDAGIKNYDVDVEILGRQPGRVHLEVRNGEPTAMTRDGRTPSQRRTWDAWTVDNQLGMIRDEFDAAGDPARGFGAPPGSRVVQRARFDPELGYPLDYQRAVFGTPLEVEWRVVNFVRR
ncbi:MAG TPA: DUF6174 domain-containing protein [Pirellulales bacterium]|nr:DUF6174 domain-containing protein [Pirellulales bacterium]